MNIVVISGSTRRGSFNTRLADLVAEVSVGHTVSVVRDLHQLPFYDADVEAEGAPPPVAALRARVTAADALVVVTPEYNGTIPGLLANALDWLSRPHGRSVLREMPVLVLSASPSRYGAVRAAEHLRAVLTTIGASVAPGRLNVAGAHLRLGPGPVDPELTEELRDLVQQHLSGARTESRHDPLRAA